MAYVQPRTLSQMNHIDLIFPYDKIIYTTNAIESLNSTYRKLNSQRSVFPSEKALMKALYLSTLQATRKWSMALRNWGQVYGEFSIMYEGVSGKLNSIDLGN
jgi:transposase-like protein